MNPYEIDPYSFKPGFESTRFITDSGLSYYVYFTDISDFGLKIYSFGFEPEGIDMDTALPLDRRVADTIATILQDNFCAGKDVIIYYPYNDDKIRLRKFDLWFTKYNPTVVCGSLERRTIEFDYDSGMITVSVIYRPECKETVDKEIVNGNLAGMWDQKA